MLSLTNELIVISMTGPREAYLLKLKSKSDVREAPNNIPESGLPFDNEHVGDRRYVLTPTDPLTPGEYAFYYAGKFFDFRIVSMPNYRALGEIVASAPRRSDYLG